MQPHQGRAAPGVRAVQSPAGFGHRKDEPVRPLPLPPVQQNLNYYPQIFWVDGCADAGAPCPPAPFPPPVPDRRRKPRSRGERRSVGSLVMFLLILVAFTGVGLSILKIFHLEKEVNELRESASAEHTPPASQKLTGQKEQPLRKEPRKAAHLTGTPSQQDLPLQWEPISGHAYTGGIQYQERGLLISEPGLYFVYSKVLFRGSGCDSQLLSHVVYKRNPASPGSLVLMEDTASHFCTGQGTWARNSYLGALFKLRKMDSLHVNVSKISLVSFEESKTFFGLFKL